MPYQESALIGMSVPQAAKLLMNNNFRMVAFENGQNVGTYAPPKFDMTYPVDVKNGKVVRILRKG